MVLSTLLYAALIWNNNQKSLVEGVQDNFIRRLLNSSRYTPGYLQRMECGRTSLGVTVLKLTLRFWRSGYRVWKTELRKEIESRDCVFKEDSLSREDNSRKLLPTVEQYSHKNHQDTGNDPGNSSKFEKVYGNFAPSIPTVEEWAAEFKRFRTSLEDDPREGQSKTATTPEAIEKMHNIVLDYRPVKHVLQLKSTFSYKSQGPIYSFLLKTTLKKFDFHEPSFYYLNPHILLILTIFLCHPGIETPSSLSACTVNAWYLSPTSSLQRDQPETMEMTFLPPILSNIFPLSTDHFAVEE
ncbi:hypothetical protein LAZ67_5001394 [Cordylochernes scorpioides]|uniref:Uncharacterized protein n=1 Tax=Cordylochernes scorpioides TaxID=51811 RepID=A0ABY6KHF2_9ARAC|nr:hypothetical protein LAZ67_5001394 [Cordylochernes scorpioides]